MDWMELDQLWQKKLLPSLGTMIKMISNVETHFEFENIKSGGILENKTLFCLEVSQRKNTFWKDTIEQNGGIVKGSVGKSISYLVAGEGSGSKSDKANKLGILIIDTKKLEELLKE